MGATAKSPYAYSDGKNLWPFAIYHSNELGSGILSARGRSRRWVDISVWRLRREI